MRFEFDKKKSQKLRKNPKKKSVLKSLLKSGNTLDEAKSVFNDPGFITVVDEEHSTDEERYISIGISANGRLVMLAHTDRDGRIRIISARKATRKEEKFYADSE